MTTLDFQIVYQMRSIIALRSSDALRRFYLSMYKKGLRKVVPNGCSPPDADCLRVTR